MVNSGLPENPGAAESGSNEGAVSETESCQSPGESHDSSSGLLAQWTDYRSLQEGQFIRTHLNAKSYPFALVRSDGAQSDGVAGSPPMTSEEAKGKLDTLEEHLKHLQVGETETEREHSGKCFTLIFKLPMPLRR